MPHNDFTESMRKLKKSKNQRLMLECDKLVKEIVFLRDGACVTCPLWMEIKKDSDKPHTPSNVMDSGHYITRGCKSVRWDLENVYKQCRTCNMLHELRPTVLGSYVLKALGEKKFNDLILRGNKPMPSIKSFQLEVLREELEAILENETQRIKKEGL